MKFGDQLLNIRKQKKLSREELAERLLVPCSVIDAWESSIAQPNIDNLIALSNELDVSLDHLCGKSFDFTFESEKGGTFRSKAIRYVIVGVIAIAVFLGGFSMGSGFKLKQESKKAYMPDTVSVSGVSFKKHGHGVKYIFTPSIAGELYSYKIHFTDYGGKTFSFDARLNGGVCIGEVELESLNIESVSVSVINTDQTRVVHIASDLDIEDSGTTWNKAE